MSLGALDGLYANPLTCGRINNRIASFDPAMPGMEHWCEILHLNVKRCRASSDDTLSLDIGRGFDQPLAAAHRFECLYLVVVATADYLPVLLNAADGPLGISDYRILFEVVALDPRRSFLHLSYFVCLRLVGAHGDAGLPGDDGARQTGLEHRRRQDWRRACARRWHARRGRAQHDAPLPGDRKPIST